MGLFSFIFGSSGRSTVKLANDRIWISEDAKFAGLEREVIARARSDSEAIFLIAHFNDALEKLNQIAANNNAEIPITATLASNLSTDMVSSLGLDEAASIDLIVAERHPIYSADESLLEFASELPCRCRVVHHLSLHDPVMTLSGGRCVEGMLERLGMTEDESIESRMVSRRIKSAQQKLESDAFGDSQANSAAEWVEKNCPQTSES